MDIEAMKTRVRMWRRSGEISKSELARMAGLGGDTTLRLIDDPEWNPTAKTLAALLAVIPPEWTADEATA